MLDLHYLNLLSKDYPNIHTASAEIIRLNAIMGLPKGTEYFFSDLHGEHKAFIHMLKSASGIIRAKIDELFSKSITENERRTLSVLIYEPEKELKRIKINTQNYDDWCRITIFRLVEICKLVGSKYTRSTVRNKIPVNFAHIIDELLHTVDDENKSNYYSSIIESIIDIEASDNFIVTLCNLIRQLAIDKLHIIGDIYDRGAHPDAIMDELMSGHDVDIQWGNHDISWMGAVCGNMTCIANVIRLAISYNNFDLIEDGYGINLRPLSSFANKTYQHDKCEYFTPHVLDQNEYDRVDISLASKMHKAMAIIQFKMEGQLIKRHPEYNMDSRRLIENIDFDNWTITINKKTLPLRDTSLPTVDPKDPLKLSKEEDELMQTLHASFRHSETLARHINFLYSNGAMYNSVNSNLLYHGCIPMTEDGEFEVVKLSNKELKGKEYLDYIDKMVRIAYFPNINPNLHEDAVDFMWFLWCNAKSPLYGKSKMSTFERYFLEDKTVCVETMNPYYKLVESREVCKKILREFDLAPEYSHIINGHVPVKIKSGETPIKGDGLLFMIDGGMSKAYQPQTGIAGYTFIFNSHHLALAEHKPYSEEAVEFLDPKECFPDIKVVERMSQRLTVKHTDSGKKLMRIITELKALVRAFKHGDIKER